MGLQGCDETRVVADRVEVRIRLGVLARLLGLELDGGLEVLDRALLVADASLEAGGVEVALRRLWMLLEQSSHEFPRLLQLALVGVGVRGEDVFPERLLEDDARFCSHRKHRRAVLGRDRAALRVWPHEDDRPGGRIDLLVTEREHGAAAQDDVHPLVVVALGVLLDHPPAGVPGVRVRAEGRDSEAASDGPPDELAVGVLDRQLLELVDVRDVVALAHESSLSSSRTTGSISATPSTRSSRLTLPAQRLNASSSSPS